MKLKALIIAFIVLSGSVFAGNTNDGDSNSSATATKTVEINGQVQDFLSGEALTGAEVSIKESQKTVYTDFDGNFSFSQMAPGTYNIVVSYISYDKSFVEQVTIKENNTKSLSIKLKDTK